MNAKNLIPAAVCALLAACTTNGLQSDLVITKVVPGVLTTTTVGGVTTNSCVLAPGTQELDSMPLDVVLSTGHVGLVLDNRLQVLQRLRLLQLGNHRRAVALGMPGDEIMGGIQVFRLAYKRKGYQVNFVIQAECQVFAVLCGESGRADRQPRARGRGRLAR